MKVNIRTREGTEGMLKKTKFFYITCHVELLPEEARLYPDCGTTVSELTPVYEYRGDEQTDPIVMMLDDAVEGQAEVRVRSLGQLQECEQTIISRCLEVQLLLTRLQDFEVEKSYTVDLIERIKEAKEKEAAHG